LLVITTSPQGSYLIMLITNQQDQSPYAVNIECISTQLDVMPTLWIHSG
jgi:hypothetical protein